MANISSVTSRRNFIQLCTTTAAAIATGFAPLAAVAGASEVLAFRKNASPLLLNYNENSLGMSALAVNAAQQVASTASNRYPDDAVARLRSTLAALHGVPVEQIIFGNGSTEVIQATVTYAEGLGATVLEPTPTFGDVRRYAEAEELNIVQVPVGQNFQTDIAALRQRATELQGPLLINICNPNNPTGTIVDNDALVKWINAAPANYVFLIDEAYFEYAQLNPKFSSMLGLIKAGKENLIVTRTFSKIYGMAGMRVGYGVAAPATAKQVRKFAAGYNLTATGVAAALASLTDKQFYQQSMQSNKAAKAILLAALDELTLEHIESNANFVLHRINSPVADYATRMADNGIRVGRRMTKDDGWNRISLGTPEEMQEFVKVLKVFRSKGWV